MTAPARESRAGPQPSSATALLGGSWQVAFPPRASVSSSDKARGREGIDESRDLDLESQETEF